MIFYPEVCVRFIVKTIYLYILFIFVTAVTAQFRRDDLWLRMNDGVRLDVTRFTPIDQPPSGGFPAVVFVHGLGGSKENMMLVAREYADSGYVTVAYSVRGQGNSEGLSTVFSTREQADLDSIINWLAAFGPVNDTLIGVSGSSQGGYHSWLAAVRGMNVHAVAPENSTPRRADAAARYGCYSTAISAELEYRQGVRLDTAAYPLKRWLVADNYDSVRAVLSRGRYFDSTDVANSTAHYLMMGAWHDHVFPHNRVAGSYAMAPQPSYMYLGVGGHNSGNSQKENLFRSDLRRRFFAQTLKGENRGLEDIDPVVVALGPDWRHIRLTAWPPPSREMLTFFLHEDGSLSSQPPDPLSSTAQIRHELLDPSYTWADAIDGMFSRVSTAYLNERRSWKSEPLSDTLKILGIPKAYVQAKGTGSRFQINLQL